MPGYGVDKGLSVSHHKPSLTVRRRQAIGPGTMDENGIKAAALTRIRREARGRALPIIASEFSLNGTGIRADIAVLDSGKFYGIEIKSASDTLKRLPSQMEGYARYFDRTVLVVAPKHLRGLNEIALQGAEVWRQEILTDWQLHREGETRRTSGHWLLQLLTADEERRVSKGIDSQNEGISLHELDALRRRGFEEAFRRRYAVTSEAFWTSVKGRKITPDDLKLLSRYYADRQQQIQIEQQRQKRWDGWITAINAAF